MFDFDETNINYLRRILSLVDADTVRPRREETPGFVFRNSGELINQLQQRFKALASPKYWKIISKSNDVLVVKSTGAFGTHFFWINFRIKECQLHLQVSLEESGELSTPVILSENPGTPTFAIGAENRLALIVTDWEAFLFILNGETGNIGALTFGFLTNEDGGQDFWVGPASNQEYFTLDEEQYQMLFP